MFQLTDNAFNSLGLIRPQNILEKYMTSLGCHTLNLANLKANSGKGIFFHGGKRTNFREHINMHAPSGFFKTTVLSFFLDVESGLLSECIFPTNVEATFTPESWAGTLTKAEDGEYYLTNGVYDRFGEGIIGADEFTVLKDMMDDKGARNDVVYLLKGLESCHISKNMAGGVVGHDRVGTTLWCCMRPTRLNFTSGLARRFNFITYYPTIAEAYAFKEANTGTRLNSFIPVETKKELRNLCTNFIDSAQTSEIIDDEEIDNWLMDREHLPHFEHWIYKRMAIGWAVVNGTYPNVVVDDMVEKLFEDEFRSRASIKNNPTCDAMVKVINEADGGEILEEDFITFMTQFYQLTRNEVEVNLKRLIYGEKRVKANIIGTKKMLSVTARELSVEVERQEYVEDIIRVG